MKKTFVKRIAMVAATMAILAGTCLNSHMTAEAACEQMMDICCPHCHENVTINIMLHDIECTHCLENIHIDG